MTISFTGIGTAIDRTIFTAKGPIVKPPISLLTGSNLSILNTTTVYIPTGIFNSSAIGKQIIISGSPGARNDGAYPISGVLNPQTLVLSGASLNAVDIGVTTSKIIALANDLKSKYNQHTSQVGVHVNPDTFNPVTALNAIDLPTAIALINDIANKFSAHFVRVLPGPIHLAADLDDVPVLPKANNLASAIILANQLRKVYEKHHQNEIVHVARDTFNYVTAPRIVPKIGSGPLAGPLNWIYSDPQYGKIADSADDVVVTVDGTPVSIDAVFGLLGAIVLTEKPTHGSVVLADYSWMVDPPTRITRIGSSEFTLNQIGNLNLTGIPGNSYKARAFLPDPTNINQDMRSMSDPQKTAWKYKAFEYAYTATLNDPNTLLLNVPSNKVLYPVYDKTLGETVIRYDPTSLPDQSLDSWQLIGDGQATIPNGTSELLLSSSSDLPVYYSHPIDLGRISTASVAFRLFADPGTPDGVFCGPAFGITDGLHIAFIGLLLSSATNLSSAIVRANAMVTAYSSHLVQTGVHRPNDTLDVVDVSSATDLPSLVTLLNRTKKLYNLHLVRGPNNVHQIVDGSNQITTPDASNLQTAINLANVLTDAFNAHRIQIGVHFNSDIVNFVGLVRQIGILNNAAYPEFITSWTCSAFDWSMYATYRLSWSDIGTASIFGGSQVAAIAQVNRTSLPAASDVDASFDAAQQIFFGNMSDVATVNSHWAFARADIIPLDATQIIGNKSVNYLPTNTPELDPFAPWITVGQGGFDRIISNTLVVDSTESATPEEIARLGIMTGAFRGFIRYEPSFTVRTSCSIEFTASIGYYTFSIDNRATGVYLDDGNLSTHFVFLQETPVAASISGNLSQPFAIVSSDSFTFALDGEIPQTLTFSGTLTTASSICSFINTVLGFTFASISSTNGITFSSTTLGSASSIQLMGGSALNKFGMGVGTYFGQDSNPEPRVSWFGAETPDRASPPWTSNGDQTANLLGRILRIEDSDVNDFLAYTFSDSLYINSVISPNEDWKLDFRVRVQSYVPGVIIPSGLGLFPCGTVVNIDEGSSGINVEVHLSVDSSGNPYLNVLTYDSTIDTLIAVGQYPFVWNDKNIHTYNIYTSKLANICVVVADNTSLGTFPMTNLKSGFSGPSITFGSGGSNTATSDLRTSQSVVDWSSICIFRDSKISDGTSASRRFIGVYKGGDPTVLNSYYLHQIDWTSTHTYRIVRDPSTNINVYVDGNPTPVISINYDVMSIPPSATSFLNPITEGRSSIAFGSFDPKEISRSVWGPIRYSIGVLTNTDTQIPSHQVLNQFNVIASPDHLRTNSPHLHLGTTSWSGGTPTDDYMANSTESAFTNLGEGTAPIPMTQNLESRGGLYKSIESVESIASIDLIDQKGFLTDLDDDTINVLAVDDIPVTSMNAERIVNDIRLKFIAHSSQNRVHVNNDNFNSLNLPVAVDLDSTIILANTLKARLNAHFVATIGDMDSPIHTSNDGVNTIITVDATDLASAVTLISSLVTAYSHHIIQNGVHGSSLIIRLDPPSRVLYEGMKFFTQTSGIAGLVAPFSDETVLTGPQVTGSNMPVGRATLPIQIDVTGVGFVAGATVLFGDVLGTSVTVVSSTFITVTPPVTSGNQTVLIRVSNPTTTYGPSTVTYTTISEPIVTSVSSVAGRSSGGSVFDVFGSGFVDGCTVFIGTVTFVSSGHLIVTTTPMAGIIIWRVENPDDQVSANQTYRFLLPPVVSAVSPNKGPASSSVTRLVTCTNVSTDTTMSCTFGGNLVTNITVTGFNTFTCLVPSHAAGTVDVIVTVDTVASTGGIGIYLFGDPPTFTSATDASTAGGASVITGTNFVPFFTTVDLGGGIGAVGITSSSPTSLSIICPAHSAGAVDVTITNPDGQFVVATGGLIYSSASGPVINKITPHFGSAAGGEFVTIDGIGFLGATSATIDGNPITTFAVVDDNTITGYSPSGSVAAGRSITVTNGTTSTLSNAWGYIPSNYKIFCYSEIGVVQSGPNVTQWTDQSGNGNHLVSPTIGQELVYNASDSDYNFRPSLTLDGVSQCLRSASIDFGRFTLFIAAKNSASTGYYYSDSWNDYLSSDVSDSTFTANRDGSGNSSYDLSAGWGVDANPRIITRSMDGTHAGDKLRINSHAQTMTNVNSGDPGTGHAANTIDFFSLNGTSSFLSGSVVWVLFYDYVLSDSDKFVVEFIISNDYGISLM